MPLRDRKDRRHDSEAYPGATRGRRGQNLAQLRGDANSDLADVLEVLRSRSRALASRNPYGGRAVRLLVNHLVGKGFRGIPAMTDVRRQDRMGKLWNAWTRNPKECDYHGKLTFNALQALIAKTLVVSGECLVRRYHADQNTTVPLQLQVLEPDFIDSNRAGIGVQHGADDVLGIRFDQGRPIGYWLYDRHPGSAHALATSRLHDADDIIHLFDVDRAGQARGFPWSTPLLLRLSDFDDAIDSELLRQKLASSYVAFITDINGQPTADPSYSEELEPGTIEVMPPGRDVKLSTPPQAPNFESFTTVMLRQIAAGYSVTYEGLTSDYSKVNYSSARMAGEEFRLTVDTWRETILLPQFFSPVWQWFRDAAEDVGPADMDWTPPRHILVDPEKEVSALVTMIRAGLVSYPDAVRSLGGDPDRLLEVAANTNARLDELGLIFDSDGRNPIAGSPIPAAEREQEEEANGQ